ncbi:TM2 domain-containing protein [Paenibacillus sp. 1_12]|uniref:TM2 domain-containing protein n=1 Tax=Paenibacillus sp. 1_12 TaxID=1566278 RepID=UPI001C468515|nr:TM2 domain-containing protein [Paenibacillus sp. 1_12]
MNNLNNPNNIYTPNKSKTTAGILAILLGGLGVHHFYLENIVLGIVYLLFCWTGIPSIIAMIEGIVYLTSSDQSFNRKYGRKN